LIGFYSFGFPLDKAIAYVQKFKPQMINDLTMQSLLWERPTVLNRLREIGIPVAESYVVLRGEDKERTKNDKPPS
jgi:inositol-hexakisphosphate/diphosphoinositol-pentakisphosphate 1-kinase